MSIKAIIIEIFESINSSLWFIPMLFVSATFLLTYGSIYLDSNTSGNFTFHSWLFFSAGAESARAVLSTIAGSMITIAGVVFSITIVVMSLASSQYGPRLLDGFMKDKTNQTVLGMFISTFLYSILILKTISSNNDIFIPHYSVNISILLSIFSVLFFIYFIHHTCKSIQASHIIDQVCLNFSKVIGSLEDKTKTTNRQQSIKVENNLNYFYLKSHKTGYVQYIDYQLLADIAIENGLVFELDLKPGAFCPDLTKIGKAFYQEAPKDERKISDLVFNCLHIGTIRTFRQDLEYGFLQLVEIALRALSPGVNDPFTAILCIDKVSSNLLSLFTKELPTGIKTNNANQIVLRYKTFDVEGIIETAFRQIRQASDNSLAVRLRIIETCNLMIDNTSDLKVINILKTQISETYSACQKMLLSENDLQDLKKRLRYLNENEKS